MSGRIRVQVSAAAERALRQGHPWVYAEAISRQRGAGSAGDLAAVYGRRNRFLAIGLYDPASPIRVRVLQHRTPAEIGLAWYRKRLADALARREALAGSDTTGYRLVHGENDRLPGLVLDRYDRVLVLKLYTASWLPHMPTLLEALEGLPSRHAPTPRTVVLRLARGVQAAAGAKWQDGSVVAGRRLRGPVEFLELGLRFRADPIHGQKTGWYLDQRENRRQAGTLAAGRRALDAFAYTGASAVWMAQGGARSVTCVDASRPALAEIQPQFALNRAQRGVAGARLEVICGDAFATLARLRAAGRRFDMVLLDPPAFAHSQDQVPAALAAYARLTRAGLGVLARGGVLVQSSCTGQVRAQEFFRTVRRAAAAAGRPLQELARTGHPVDHPVGFPEGAYLKCLFAVVR